MTGEDHKQQPAQRGLWGRASSALRPLPSALRPWAFRAALALAARTPRRLGYGLGALGGELYFWLNPRHSGKAVANFAVLLADDPRAPRVRDTARRSFRNYGKYLFDFFHLPTRDPEQIEAEIITEPFDHLDAALAAGRGALIVTPHFGNWDYAGTIIAVRGYPISAVADVFAPPALDRLVRAARECFGLGVIPLDRGGGLRQIQRALRRNGIVALVADRPRQEGGAAVEFFGARAWLPAGPARIALRTGAPVLPGFVVRRPGDRTYFGEVGPAIPFTPTGDEAADVQALTQALAGRLEGLLRRHPDQWYMFREMWPETIADCGLRIAEYLPEDAR